MKSWKVEVLVAGETKWASNSLRFKTKEDATDYAHDLMRRWLSVDHWRVIPSEDEANREAL